MKLDLNFGSGNISPSKLGWNTGTSVRKKLKLYPISNICCIFSNSVYSVLGFGYASAGLMIIVEIIFSKLTRRNSQRTGSPLATILLLLVLSASLTTATIWMRDTFYDHTYDPCLLVAELCEWEDDHIMIPSSEEWNICGI